MKSNFYNLIKARITIGFLCVIIASTLNAQFIEKSRSKFLYQDTEFGRYELGPIMKMDDEAHSIYEKFLKANKLQNKCMFTSGVIFFGGSLVVYYRNNQEPVGDILLIFGILGASSGCLLGALINSINASFKLSSAIDTFNARNGLSRVKKYELHLGVQDHGIGIGLIF